MRQRPIVAYSIAALMAVGLFASAVLAQRPTDATSPAARPNPLLTESALPFQAPPFDKVTDADFEPAFAKGIADQNAEVEQIANNPASPTFDNTFVALERSGQTLSRVEMVFNALSSANTDDALDALQEKIAPQLSAHEDDISLNPRLFRRIETIFNARDHLHLTPEAKRLVEYQYQQFVMAGAKLSDSDKARLKALNAEDAALSAKFMTELRAATKDGAVVFKDVHDLGGLSEGELAAAAEAAKSRQLEGQWLIALVNTTQQPLLTSLSNRASRDRLFHASWTRTERGDGNDTRATIVRLAQLRVEKAQVLGLPNFAAWRLQDQMAKTPSRVEQFLDDLAPAATAHARAEAKDLQARIDEQHGSFSLEPWDWNYYAEQIRKAKFDLDANDVKPYFVLDRVLTEGVLYAAHELYGLTFKERHDLPVYQPDVRVFEVFDVDGSHLGLIYFDYFARDNKNGGAWMDTLVTQSKLMGTRPVVYNVANFAKPAPGQPALITFDDVTTMFHEFGHALHGLFANQMYPTLSGTAVARDFVEFPSQFNEHWALNPLVLPHYAHHYQTNATMPQELIDKIKKAATFNQGYALTELLEAADLDMAWHTLTGSAAVPDVDQFETDALARAHVDVPQVPPRYRSSYFLHIWANGYNAGYYAYLWTEMLDDDAFAWFTEHGGLTRANGQRFRNLILSKGNTEDYAKMFRDFRGRDPVVEPMLIQRGLRQQDARQ